MPRLVEKYKQAILSAAFRGDLTTMWRRTRLSAPTGRELRAYLLQEHECWYRDNTTNQKVPVVDFSGETVLPPLPMSWTWMPVAGLATSVVDGVHKKPTYVDKGIPFVTVRNLTAGSELTFEGCRFITEADHGQFTQRTAPTRGDILISKDGTLGVTRAVRTDERFSIFVSVALVKPLDRSLTDYLELAFQSPVVQQQMVGVGTGLQHIHLIDLKRDLIPVAPPEEREEMVKRINTAFAWIDRLAAETTSARKLIDHLDQAVLAKAFRGELVPQDPNDEGASVLLERIRASRQAAPDRNHRRRQTRKSA